MTRPGTPNDFPWDELEHPEAFCTPEWTARILDGLSVYRPHSREVDPERRSMVVKLLHRWVHVVRERLLLLEKQLKRQFVGKDDIIRMMIVAAIAQQPMLILGKPGVAKSALVQRFCDGLGIGRIGDPRTVHTCFKYLLHAFTEPDEILGVLDVQALTEQKKFIRHRAGSITEATVIFLDEVFRANSAILNALLSIINERRVYEGGTDIRANARLVYGAANQLPTGKQREDLGAFLERFILRMESELVPLEIASQGGRRKDREELLRKGWSQEVKEQRAGYDPVLSASEPVACLNDILLCNRAATEFWGGEEIDGEGIREFIPHYHDLVSTLGGEKPSACSIDDRKFIKLFMVVRAHSLYVHGGSPTVSDLEVFGHTWDNADSRSHLQGRVKQFIDNLGPKKG